MNSLKIFYDETCPVCSREIRHLKKRNTNNLVQFLDISSNEALLKQHGLTFDQAMRRMHGIMPDGRVLEGIDLFIELYRLVNLKWLSSLLAFRPLNPFWRFCYKIFAKKRYNAACKRFKK
ncbi:MAG: DUF393 domain-containing protein [Parachlamydiales bacterium]|nr:DUF393 domain-containing protein [Parachlamydiales bacterium]